MEVGFLPANKNTENRKLADSPNIPTTVQEIKNWPKSYQSYFTDHFGGRTLLFDINMSLKSALSAKPFKDNKLVVGKEGWYFSNFQKVIDDYRAVRPFTSEQLQKIKKQLIETKNDLNKQGIKYYLLIVPNKHTIYSDKLPSYIQKIGKHTRLEQLLAALKSTSIPVVDIRDEMLKDKNKRQLYFKTDSHWNVNGSFIGYQSLMNVVSKDFPEINPFSIGDFKLSQRKIKGGDIVAMMGKQDEIEGVFYDYKPKFKARIHKATIGNYEMPEPKIFHPKKTVSAFEGGNTDLKAVVFKDSYGGYMEQFLNLHFKRAVYVWGHDYKMNQKIVETEKPDLVIQVIVERYIYTLLESSQVTDN